MQMNKEDDLLSTNRCLGLYQVCLTNLWASHKYEDNDYWLKRFMRITITITEH